MTEKIGGAGAGPERFARSGDGGGRARIRDANLRHGFYSKSDEAALRALGEDPHEFQEMLERLVDQSTALGALQEQLGDRLARGFQRMKRAARMQEGVALRQAREEDGRREGRLHVQMMRLKMTARNWQWLAQSVARTVNTQSKIVRCRSV